VLLYKIEKRANMEDLIIDSREEYAQATNLKNETKSNYRKKPQGGVQ